MSGQKKEILSLELMRVLAAFFVIFNHTSSSGHFLFSLYPSNSIQYWLYMFPAAFCHFAVPLFFMISGALLLGRNDEARPLVPFKKALHILIILVIWSFIYYLSTVYEHRNYMTIDRDANPYLSFVAASLLSFDFRDFLIRLFELSGWNHTYWFLHTYIAFLLALPLLQCMAQAFKLYEYKLLFSLFLVFFMLIPAIQYLIWRGNHNFDASIYTGLKWISGNTVIFPLTGYFLQHRLNNVWTRKRLLILWGINILGLLCSCYLTFLFISTTGNSRELDAQGFLSWSGLINAATVFVTCRYIDEHTAILKRFEKEICSLGNATLGIYLSHLYFLHRSDLSSFLWRGLREGLHLNPLLYALVYCVLIFICGLLTTKLLQKIPFLRNLVR